MPEYPGGTLLRMTVNPIPAPRNVMPFRIRSVWGQVAVPAGTDTVSPATAEATAAATSEYAGLAAEMLLPAAVDNCVAAPSATKMASTLRKALGQKNRGAGGITARSNRAPVAIRAVAAARIAPIALAFCQPLFCERSHVD